MAAVVVVWKLACHHGSNGTPTTTGSAASGPRIVKPAAQVTEMPQLPTGDAGVGREPSR